MSMREHARIHKPVINLDHGGSRHVMCAWDDCERQGYELHKCVVNNGTARQPQLLNYVFCSERHKMFWINSQNKYGSLPPGYKRSFI
jgi:hypothetical protein